MLKNKVDVVVCEFRADEPGHYSTWLADITGELARRGLGVGTLTSRGWALGPDDSIPGVSVAARMDGRWRGVRRVGSALCQAAEWTRGRFPRTSPLCAFFTGAGLAIRQYAYVMAVNQIARTWGSRRVIVLSPDLNPLWASVVAHRNHRWVTYQLLGPGYGVSLANFRKASLLLAEVARMRHALRKRAGSRVVVAANNPSARAAWVAEYPWVETRLVPAAVAFEVAPEQEQRQQARIELGLDTHKSIALLFGYVRSEKDVKTVFSAFCDPRTAGQLLAVGEHMGYHFADFAARHPDVDISRITVIDGFVDADAMRLVHCAADFAILSFIAGVPNDSGTLANAVSYNLPVVASTPCNAADDVIHYGIGLTFDTADVNSLCDTIAQLNDFHVDSAGRERFLYDHSIMGLVDSLLTAIDR